jgi:hypothetical protein
MTHDDLILLAALGWAAAGAMVLVAAWFAGQARVYRSKYEFALGIDFAYRELMKIVDRK